jgi:DNA-directed RNA polymerase subunit M/transcription elongation factor TFIIS
MRQQEGRFTIERAPRGEFREARVATRNLCNQQLLKLKCHEGELGPAALRATLQKGARLELACYAAALDIVTQDRGDRIFADDAFLRQQYASVCYRVLVALDEGEVDPGAVTAPAAELAPRATAPFEQAIEARRSAKIRVKESKHNRCPRKGCDSRKIECRAIQTRSADEANRMSYKCMECGLLW